MSITVILIIINLIVTITGFNNPAFFEKFCAWPYKEKHNKEYYRMLSGAFLHGSWLHFLVNMFVFWQFGTIVEAYYDLHFGTITGAVLYTFMYLLTIILANLPGHFTRSNDYNFRAVGASGGVSGILFIYILIAPWAMLYLYGIIPIPGILAGLGYLYYSSYAAKNSNDNIDHSAHFWGAIAGMIITILIYPPIFSHFFNSLLHNFPF